MENFETLIVTIFFYRVCLRKNSDHALTPYILISNKSKFEQKFYHQYNL